MEELELDIKDRLALAWEQVNAAIIKNDALEFAGKKVIEAAKAMGEDSLLVLSGSKLKENSECKPEKYEFLNWTQKEINDIVEHDKRPFDQKFSEDGEMTPEPEDIHIPVCYYLAHSLSKFKY